MKSQKTQNVKLMCVKVERKGKKMQMGVSRSKIT